MNSSQEPGSNSSSKKTPTTPIGTESEGATATVGNESTSLPSMLHTDSIPDELKNSSELAEECLRIFQEDLGALIKLGFDIRIIPKLEDFDYPVIALRDVRLVDGNFVRKV